LEEASKCLVGRLVLLNKDHPEIPKVGRFRPIRICSNIVKMLEKHLFKPLAKWGNRSLKAQFGFRQGVGPETARHFVFKTLVRAGTTSRLTWVCQIDLANAYNTVNLFFLNELIKREGFWNETEQQLWRFLVTNAQTEFNGKLMPKINGLPQGSLLSPLLFNLYINDIFDRLNQASLILVVAFADDLIMPAETREYLEEALKIC